MGFKIQFLRIHMWLLTTILNSTGRGHCPSVQGRSPSQCCSGTSPTSFWSPFFSSSTFPQTLLASRSLLASSCSFLTSSPLLLLLRLPSPSAFPFLFPCSRHSFPAIWQLKFKMSTNTFFPWPFTHSDHSFILIFFLLIALPIS